MPIQWASSKQNFALYGMTCSHWSFSTLQITAMATPATMGVTARCHPQLRTIHAAVEQGIVESTALNASRNNQFWNIQTLNFVLVLFRIWLLWIWAYWLLSKWWHLLWPWEVWSEMQMSHRILWYKMWNQRYVPSNLSIKGWVSVPFLRAYRSWLI